MTPDVTPYCSGLPIDTIPESDKDVDSPMFQECKQKYQSIVGSIGWLAQSTHPDLAPSHSFLSAYSNKPSCSHWNAALYVLHYIHSTVDYGISFKPLFMLTCTFLIPWIQKPMGMSFNPNHLNTIY